MIDYNRYINSRAWKLKRLAVLTRDHFRCVKCKRARATQVHHKTYINLGNEPLEDLESLCRPCHQKTTIRHRKSVTRQSNDQMYHLP